ncbi:MAG: CopG family transcriptional regulator [Planctomyces sp.]|jgi:uncharacterized protein (DUF4415 family)|nr:CopG family transcriptional regulator [Planctomyces sp.]
MSEKEYNFEQAERGPVIKPSPGKSRITIRIDTDTLNWFRRQVNEAGGGNYQTLINDALREYLQYRGDMLETTLRKVIREELDTIKR